MVEITMGPANAGSASNATTPATANSFIFILRPLSFFLRVGLWGTEGDFLVSDFP
jgi:hypothetical protein